MAQKPLYTHPYPPPLTPAQTAALTTTLSEWALAHGLVVRPSADTLGGGGGTTADLAEIAQRLATTAPVTLFPSLFPRRAFDEARGIQTAYNECYARVVMDEGWLGEVVKGIVGIDEYIAKLWDVHVKVKEEGYVQDLALGLFRSDYMVHVDETSGTPTATIRQVEFNTIASSFGGLAAIVSQMHNYLHLKGEYPDAATSIITADALPADPSIQGLSAGLAHAHKAYGPAKSPHPLCILFIVQDSERNVFDAKHLEHTLLTSHRIQVFRLPFPRVLTDTSLDDARTLLYTPPAHPSRTYEATTVYYRAGYAPSEYTSPSAWGARLHLERSAAIKCPSILTHLAGSKKVQQILATPDSAHLDRFSPPATAARLRRTFAPMYGFDPSPSSSSSSEAEALATNEDSAARFVLKPQREGGGNNVYRAAIPAFLASIPAEQWPAYVLMEMIETPAQRNAILRDGKVAEGGVICELGVYGACLWRMPRGEGGEGEILVNEEAGYLLRTKGDASEEGGVAAGFGAVDSPCLVDV